MYIMYFFFNEIVQRTHREWSLITGRGGGYKTGAGASEVLPLRKGRGAEKVLAMLKVGGTQQVLR